MPAPSALCTRNPEAARHLAAANEHISITRSELASARRCVAKAATETERLLHRGRVIALEGLLVRFGHTV